MKALLLIYLIFLPLYVHAQKDILIIVNANNPVERLSPFQISEMYLKKNRTWNNGESVRFFDRNDESSTRREFLNKFIKRSSRDIDQYWIGQKLYTGNSAPVQVTSDSMAISLVSRFPGAIGYISPENYQENKGIKKVEIDTTP